MTTVKQHKTCVLYVHMCLHLRARVCVCPYSAGGVSNCMAIHKSKPDHVLLFCPLYKCMYIHIIRIYIKIIQ